MLPDPTGERLVQQALYDGYVLSRVLDIMQRAASDLQACAVAGDEAAQRLAELARHVWKALQRYLHAMEVYVLGGDMPIECLSQDWLTTGA
jgi:hypothetical protein